MIKLITNCLLVLSLLIICIVFSGCDKAHGNQHIDTVALASDIRQLPSTSSQMVEPRNLSPYDTNYLVDYKYYLKKIWIVKDWDERNYYFPFSFVITKIDNRIIEGEFTSESVAEPVFYSSYYSSSPYLPNFNDAKDLPRVNLKGTVVNNKAECQFDDMHGGKGNIVLVFKENNDIDATIEYVEKNQDYEGIYEKIYREMYGDQFMEQYKGIYAEGHYAMRPYNFSDTPANEPTKIYSIKTDLDTWGQVSLIAVLITGNKPFPAVYLADGDNDILYFFSAPFQVGTEIIDISVEDINNDGLKDIRIITKPIYGDSNDFFIEWQFFQLENGLFYDSNNV